VSFKILEECNKVNANVRWADTRSQGLREQLTEAPRYNNSIGDRELTLVV